MGNFKCELLKHSVNPVGDEAITFLSTYERFIHAEVMTHRWCRNASSSRAIPYEKMIDWIRRDPAMPLHLGSNKKGMQSGGQIGDTAGAYIALSNMFHMVVGCCNDIVEQYDLHKEVINRYTEPWGWINVIMTMGRPQLMNFFSLRITKYAHPNMQRLAVWMARLYRRSIPQRLAAGEWHLPFSDDLPLSMPIEQRLHWSVARSAWLSYKTVDGKEGSYEQAKKRHDDCVSLKHATPIEHQLEARADHGRNGGPVAGYNQYRHMIANESASEFDFTILDREYADRDYIV